jgi:hypothetical protein
MSTNISEAHVAKFFNVEEYAKQESSVKAACYLLSRWFLA